MPTRGTTPASMVRLAYVVFGCVEDVVSPVAEPAIVNVPVVPISGFTPGDGFESVPEAPAPVEVKAYPLGRVNLAL